MNHHEATRFAHRIIGALIRGEVAANRAHQHPESWVKGPDGDKILNVLAHWAELHARRGPISTDRAPRAPAYKGEPLPFDAQPETHPATSRGDRVARAPLGDEVAHTDPGDPPVDRGVVDQRAPHVDAAAQRVEQVIERTHTTAFGQMYATPPPARETPRLTWGGDETPLTPAIAALAREIITAPGTPPPPENSITAAEFVEGLDPDPPATVIARQPWQATIDHDPDAAILSPATVDPPVALCPHRRLKRNKWFHCVLPENHDDEHQLVEDTW